MARSSKVAEEIYEEAKVSGTEIVVANNPTLFKFDATPEQHFFRRIAFAVAEYERDVLVERLQSGLRTAAAKRGGGCCAGPQEHPREDQAHSAAEEGPEKLIAQRAQGDFGYRPLVEQMSGVLKLDSCMSMETCRRLCKSLGC